MEKLIYVHVARFGDSLHRKKGKFSGRYDATNDWYAIKQRSEGRGDRVKISLVFEDVGELNHPYFAPLDTADCVVIGSRLYVIGGRCLTCDSGKYPCEYSGSAAILCLDTRYPEDGWRTCFTLPLPFTSCVARSAAVDGTLVAYKRVENTLYQLDCKNNAWTVYHKDFLPYDSEELRGSSFAVDDDGILYIYLCLTMRLISFDIRNKKELHAVDLPRSFWFENPARLLVLSKNKFCLLWDRRGNNRNERCIYYSKFSVSYDDLPDPTLDIEETRSFLVVGYRVLNFVTVDPPADVGSSRVDVSGGGEKPK
ncbi:hypothetical protein K1719_005672 [Acacia pycnantha]|nr:hypothetical protein K1719_005672 [Acacia pycnantha]